MTIDFTILDKLAKQGQHEACVVVAREMLSAHLNLQAAEQAHLLFYLSLGYFHGQDFAASIREGLVGALLAEQSGEHDLRGKLLITTANAQYAMGRIEEALASLEQFLAHINLYSPAVKKQEGIVLLNLGVFRRALGQYEEALQQLRRARVRLQGEDPINGELCRSYIAWVQLKLGQLKEAEKLIAEGDEYLRRHPEDEATACRHLWDKGQLALLKGERAEAGNLAWEALGLSGGRPFECARACLLLADVALGEGRPDEAVFYALSARIAADHAARPDVAQEASQFLVNRLVTDCTAVERVVRALTGRTA